jgi:predicted O-linked N-acetylglucosamine transferase (SPINDLY family)
MPVNARTVNQIRTQKGAAHRIRLTWLPLARRNRHIEIDRVGRHPVDRAAFPPERPAYDASLGPVVVGDGRDLGRLYFLVPGSGHLETGREVSPELKPVHPPGGVALGHLLVDDAAAGRHPAERALLHFHHATILQPAHAAFHHALAESHRTSGRAAEAVTSFRAALHADATCAAAHHGLGVVLLDEGRIDQAVASFRQALALQPDQARVHTNLGRALHRKGDAEAAAACFREALRIWPDYAIPHNNLGAILQAQNQLDAAGAHFRQALELQPDYPEAHYNLGTILQALGDPAAAVGAFREALRLRPEYPRALLGLGQALEALCDFPPALACYREAVRLQPGFVEAYQGLGSLLKLKPDWEGARAAFDRVLALQPDNAEAFSQLFVTKQMLCDWAGWDADFARLWNDAARQFADGKPTSVQPFFALTTPWSPAQQLTVARSHSDHLSRAAGPLRERIGIRPTDWGRKPGERLRIGYLSGDFRNHPVSHLLQGVLALHDRRAYEVFAYSFGLDDGSPARQRIERDCEHFVDLREASLEATARRIQDDRPHILVDLQVYTGIPRMSLLALRPAPIQVAYLGYPGTSGADFLDYLIGDPVVTPPARHADYRENLVRLPHCFLATDNDMAIPTTVGRRADQGLPNDAMVFCAFNNSYKLEPERFAVWMRILERVPGSVLWLSSVESRVQDNLRHEAQVRNVAGDRLVFASNVAKPEHVARHRHADLFLDTAFYNGHMTACDALWAGLPVLTCPGPAFASRVAASLLVNIGMPELVATNPEEYQHLAIYLAGHPTELQSLRDKLAANRTTRPLFDTPRLTRNLERAYRAMWDLHETGNPPRPIDVTESYEIDPAPPRTEAP